MSGWPDAARPGVPLNPERDGWHWIGWGDNDRVEAVRWVPNGVPNEAGCYLLGGSNSLRTPSYVCARWRYLGPCLTPAEVAAREAAAFKRGAEAMRERATKVADSASLKLSGAISNEWGYSDSRDVRERYWSRKNEADEIAAAIRALPVPEDRNE